MDEIFSPAHGLNLGAIIFVAGGAWFMLQSISRRLGRVEKKAEDFITDEDFRESIREITGTLKDIASSLDKMIETVTGHISWATTKAGATDGKIMELGERISKQEGMIATFSAAIQRLDMTIKEVDGVRERVHTLANEVIKAQLLQQVLTGKREGA